MSRPTHPTPPPSARSLDDLSQGERSSGIATQVATFEGLVKNMLEQAASNPSHHTESSHIARISVVLRSMHFVTEESTKCGELKTKDVWSVVASYIGITHFIAVLPTARLTEHGAGTVRDSLMFTTEYQMCLSYIIYMWVNAAAPGVDTFRQAVGDRTFHQLFVLCSAIAGASPKHQSGARYRLLRNLCALLDPLRTVTGTVDMIPKQYGDVRAFWPILNAELANLIRLEAPELQRAASHPQPPAFQFPPAPNVQRRSSKPMNPQLAMNNPHLIHPALLAAKSTTSGALANPPALIQKEALPLHQLHGPHRFWKDSSQASVSPITPTIRHHLQPIPSATPPVSRRSSVSTVAPIQGTHTALSTQQPGGKQDQSGGGGEVAAGAASLSAAEPVAGIVPIISPSIGCAWEADGQRAGDTGASTFILSLAKQYPRDNIISEESFYSWLSGYLAQANLLYKPEELAKFFRINRAEICLRDLDLARLYSRFEATKASHSLKNCPPPLRTPSGSGRMSVAQAQAICCSPVGHALARHVIDPGSVARKRKDTSEGVEEALAAAADAIPPVWTPGKRARLLSPDVEEQVVDNDSDVGRPVGPGNGVTSAKGSDEPKMKAMSEIVRKALEATQAHTNEAIADEEKDPIVERKGGAGAALKSPISLPSTVGSGNQVVTTMAIPSPAVQPTPSILPTTISPAVLRPPSSSNAPEGDRSGSVTPAPSDATDESSRSSPTASSALSSPPIPASTILSPQNDRPLGPRSSFSAREIGAVVQQEDTTPFVKVPNDPIQPFETLTDAARKPAVYGRNRLGKWHQLETGVRVINLHYTGYPGGGDHCLQYRGVETLPFIGKFKSCVELDASEPFAVEKAVLEAVVAKSGVTRGLDGRYSFMVDKIFLPIYANRIRLKDDYATGLQFARPLLIDLINGVFYRGRAQDEERKAAEFLNFARLLISTSEKSELKRGIMDDDLVAQALGPKLRFLQGYGDYVHHSDIEAVGEKVARYWRPEEQLVWFGLKPVDFSPPGAGGEIV